MLVGFCSNSLSQWDGRIRVKAEKLMESVHAWPDCSPDLITSIRVTAAFPTLWAASGRAICMSYESYIDKEKVIHIHNTLTKRYMKYLVKDLEGLIFARLSRVLLKYTRDQRIIIILGFVWLCKDFEYYICDSHTYLRGRLSSFKCCSSMWYWN